MHNRPDVDTDGKGCKPRMILDYNATKGAVDTFDQSISYYSCSRQTDDDDQCAFFLLDWCRLLQCVRHVENYVHEAKRTRWQTPFVFDYSRRTTHSPFHWKARANLPKISHQPSVYRAMLSVGVQPVFCEPETQKSRKRGRAVPEKKTSRLKTDAVNASNLFARNTRQKTRM